MITMSSFKYAGLIISIIISLISCTHNKNYPTAFQPELAKAEAMMYRYPDSALHILQGIQPDIPSENEQYATWALLMTQAQYKNQIEQSDSLINIAYSYFTMKIHENETLINRNKMRIEELTIQMEGSLEIKEQWKEQNKIRQEIQQQNETLKLENNNLQNHISNYAQSLKEKSKELEAMEHLSKENQYLHKREAFLCNQLIKQTELFNKLKTTKYIDNKLWQEIKEKIDLLFDNYTKRLCHQIPSLTDGDIQICCLIKLRFSNGDIANMLAISPTSVSKRKLRLKERIVQEIGSLGENQSLDLWLMEY